MVKTGFKFALGWLLFQVVVGGTAAVISAVVDEIMKRRHERGEMDARTSSLWSEMLKNQGRTFTHNYNGDGICINCGAEKEEVEERVKENLMTLRTALKAHLNENERKSTTEKEEG